MIDSLQIFSGENLLIEIIVSSLFSQIYFIKVNMLGTYSLFHFIQKSEGKSQIKILENQLGIRSKIEETNSSATERPFFYLLIDLSTRTESDYMLVPGKYRVVYK